MRLYSGTTQEFSYDTTHNALADKLETAFHAHFGHKPSPGELTSWINSSQFIKNVVQEAMLSDNMIVLEYEIPYSNGRIDYLLFGKAADGSQNVVVVEAKQWQNVEPCDVEENIITVLGNGKRMTEHPAYQVQGYHHFLKDFVTVFSEAHPVNLYSCVYCHNYDKTPDSVLFSQKFKEINSKYPVFAKQDFSVLADYLKERLGGGSGLEIFNRVIESRIAPSKKLLEHARMMIDGQKTFNLIDDQIVANNTIVDRAKKAAKLGKKSVIIVRGGPGTGKSVIALNVLAEMASMNKPVFHATGSSAFTKTLRKIAGSRASHLFKYFMDFPDTKFKENEVPVLICDEAHRIRSKSNSIYTPREFRSDMPQVEQLIRAAKVSVFFIDDYQVVRPNELGSSKLIRETAERLGAEVFDFELKTQFRCNGSDGYLNWIDNTLVIRDTANVQLTKNEKMEFKIFDSPEELDAAIRKKNEEKPNSARLVAGFCWKWSDPRLDGTLVDDVVIGNFKRTWEAKKPVKGAPEAALWAHDPRGIDQIGSIYTIQGFEFEYVGVIFGKDLVYDQGKGEWAGHPENSADSVVKRSKETFLQNVKNTYRVLMTRGMKGCYVYFLDKDTKEFVQSRINHNLDL